MIVSVSRRTDIAAFYPEWFMNRIREGYVLTRNPFNATQVRRVSLLSSDVDAIVFWTRNAEKLVPHLPTLDTFGYKYYFQYTITGYPRTIEKSVPLPLRAIKTFSKLSDLLGPHRVIWRYDPILLSNLVGIDEHKRLFTKIATLLNGKTKMVVVSFADIYKKTERNLNAIETLQYQDIVLDRSLLIDLSCYMHDVALSNGMEIQTCAEKVDLTEVGISHGKCIDDALLESEFGLKLSFPKDKGQREECGCVKSIDIGQYNTCSHGCAYCYATYNNNVVAKNKRLHDPQSPLLVGNLGLDTHESLELNEEKRQPDLF